METKQKSNIILAYFYNAVHWYNIHYIYGEKYRWLIMSPEKTVNGKYRLCLYILDKDNKILIADIVMKDTIKDTLEAIHDELDYMITVQIKPTDAKVKANQFRRYIKALELGNINVYKTRQPLSDPSRMYYTMDGMKEILCKLKYLVDNVNNCMLLLSPCQPTYSHKWVLHDSKEKDFDNGNEHIINIGFCINEHNNNTNETREKILFTITIHEDSTLIDILEETYNSIEKSEKSLICYDAVFDNNRKVLCKALCGEIKAEIMKENINIDLSENTDNGNKEFEIEYKDYNPFYLYDCSESQRDAYTELLRITEPKGEQERRFWHLALTTKEDEEKGKNAIVEIYTNKNVTPLDYKMNLSLTDGDTREILNNLFHYLNLQYISNFNCNEIVSDFAKNNLNSNLSINEITIEAERLHEEMKNLCNLIEKTYQTYVEKENNNSNNNANLMEELKEEYNSLIEEYNDILRKTFDDIITSGQFNPSEMFTPKFMDTLQEYIKEK